MAPTIAALLGSFTIPVTDAVELWLNSGQTVAVKKARTVPAKTLVITTCPPFEW
jgi:hypothetical protein